MANNSFHGHHFHYFPCLFMFFHILPSLHALNFNYTNFSGSSSPRLNISGDAEIVNGKIALTQCLADADPNFSVGRAVYPKEMHLWDLVKGKAADFVTHFSFNISSLNGQPGGDGFAFFIAPGDSSIPKDANNGCMGLISNCSNFNTSEMVAVEFDTNRNPWDPISDIHVGININSIISVASLKWDKSMKNGSIGKAWISYDSRTSNLSVFLTFLENPIFIEGKNSSLSYQVNLSEFLPERVAIGFSSSTGNHAEMHYILSWDFNSTELSSSNNRGAHVGLKVACVVGGFFIIVGIISISVFSMSKTTHQREKNKDSEQDDSIDHEFENVSGPRRFTYVELVQATNNFAEEGKLGEGGFGGVYRGFLAVLNLSIAVKRVSKMSNQGRKEYMSEVKIISKLRHKNLVQLIGWCHKNGEFLLVYELMSHGSLDSRLFGGQNLQLSWGLRYKIALGLASALLYLHEESEECVVHRDIKSSNVMLDSNFNAKLGDFGLARIMNQESGLETTGLAGTFGYMAPEYISSGQVSKRSDVYSFGVVALEIASGRRSIERRKEEATDISLVDRVWNSYEIGRILEVADEKLCNEFDMEQMDCLVIVGLWCAHPDHNLRPSIRQALQVLNFEAPLPNLCKKTFAPTSHMHISPSSSIEPMLSNSVLFMGR